jgi:hypothetical protein
MDAGPPNATVRGRALQLLGMVSGWRSTYVEVDGSPEQTGVVMIMLWCARGWLRDKGRCGASFSGPLPARCRCCPLYSPEWALESCPTPDFSPTPDLFPWEEGPQIQIPDHLPPEWEEGV